MRRATCVSQSQTPKPPEIQATAPKQLPVCVESRVVLKVVTDHPADNRKRGRRPPHQSRLPSLRDRGVSSSRSGLLCCLHLSVFFFNALQLILRPGPHRPSELVLP